MSVSSHSYRNIETEGRPETTAPALAALGRAALAVLAREGVKSETDGPDPFEWHFETTTPDGMACSRDEERCRHGEPRAVCSESLCRLLWNDPTLTEVRIRDVDTSLLEEIGTALKENTALTVLDLNRNEIGNGGVDALCAALRENTALTELDLSYNRIRAGGAEALGAALRENTTVTVLDLSYNGIGAGGAEA